MPLDSTSLSLMKAIRLHSSHWFMKITAPIASAKITPIIISIPLLPLSWCEEFCMGSHALVLQYILCILIQRVSVYK